MYQAYEQKVTMYQAYVLKITMYQAYEQKVIMYQAYVWWDFSAASGSSVAIS